MTQASPDLASALRILEAQGWLAERSKAARAKLSAIAKLRNFVKDDRIYLAGDPANGMFGLVSGSLNISFPRGDGEDYTTTAPVPGSGSATSRSSPASPASFRYARPSRP
jgi:CRP-like cAMP-binding protein